MILFYSIFPLMILFAETSERLNLKFLFKESYLSDPEEIESKFSDYILDNPKDYYIRSRYANLLVLNGKSSKANIIMEKILLELDKEVSLIRVSEFEFPLVYAMYLRYYFGKESYYDSGLSKFSELLSKRRLDSELVKASLTNGCFDQQFWNLFDKENVSEGNFLDYAKPTVFLISINFHSNFFHHCPNQTKSLRESIEKSRSERGYNSYLNILYDLTVADSKLSLNLERHQSIDMYLELRKRIISERQPFWILDQLNYRLYCLCRVESVNCNLPAEFTKSFQIGEQGSMARQVLEAQLQKFTKRHDSN